MNEKTVARTFRITESFSEKLDALCTELGIKQAAALDSLITAYEMQQSKAILPDRKTEIEDYDTHIQALQSAFLHALEVTENTEQRVRAEFQRQLESKDSMIISLQESIKSLETKVQAADERAVNAETDAQARIEAAEKTAHDLQCELDGAAQKTAEQAKAIDSKDSIITDKERIITSLQGELQTAKTAADSVPELTTRATTAETSLAAAQREIESLNQRLADEKASAEQAAALAAERAELAVQKAIVDEQQRAAVQAKEHVEETKELYAQIAKLKEEIQAMKLESLMQS